MLFHPSCICFDTRKLASACMLCTSCSVIAISKDQQILYTLAFQHAPVNDKYFVVRVVSTCCSDRVSAIISGLSTEISSNLLSIQSPTPA